MSAKNEIDEFADFSARRVVVEQLRNELAADWQHGLSRVRSWLAHPSEDLRRDIYAMLWQVGLKSTELTSRQQVIELLLERVELEVGWIRDQLLGWLSEYDFEDFTPRAVEQLQNVHWPRDGAHSVIRLLGIAEVRKSIPSLQELAKGLEHEVGRQWYAADAWAALLALARMGDRTSTLRVIERVAGESDIVVRATILLRDLAYTRQQDAFDMLRKYLNSNERLPSSRGFGLGRYEAIYVPPLMARYLADFPWEKVDYTELDLVPIRAWADAQTKWKFK